MLFANASAPMGVNLFAYALNNPVNNVDPEGKTVFGTVLLISAIFGAVAGGYYGYRYAQINGFDMLEGIGIGTFTGGIGGLFGGLLQNVPFVSGFIQGATSNLLFQGYYYLRYNRSVDWVDLGITTIISSVLSPKTTGLWRYVMPIASNTISTLVSETMFKLNRQAQTGNRFSNDLQFSVCARSINAISTTSAAIYYCV